MSPSAAADLQWWKEFFSVVRMMGYNDWVSLEMEDLTMSVMPASPLPFRRCSRRSAGNLRRGATAAAPLSLRFTRPADTVTATAPSPV